MYSLSRKQPHAENDRNPATGGTSSNNAFGDFPQEGIASRTSTSMGSRLISSAKRAIAAPVSPKQSYVRKSGFKSPLDYGNSSLPPTEKPMIKSLKTNKPGETEPIVMLSSKMNSTTNRSVGSSADSRNIHPTNQASGATGSSHARMKDPSLQPRPMQVSDSSQPRKGEKRKVLRKKVVTRKSPSSPSENLPLSSTKQHARKQTGVIEGESSEIAESRMLRKAASKRSMFRSIDEQYVDNQKSIYQDGNQNSHIQGDLNEMAAKHAEEMYWMKLELNTVRKSKEAVEDRIAELYRDVQDVLQQPNTENGSSQYFGDESILNSEDLPTSNGMVLVKSDTVATMQNQIDKYERMLRIMKHQTDLIKNSSESVVTSLKEEISNLMEEKTRTEMNLMNKLAEVHREKRDLAEQLIHFQQKAQKDQEHNEANEELEQVKFNLKLMKAENKRLREQLQTVATRITSNVEDDSYDNTMNDENDAEVKDQLRQQIELLQSTNIQLTESIQNARQTALVNLKKWNKDKIALQDQIKQLAMEVTSLRSLGDSAELIRVLETERDSYSGALDRVSLLVKNVNEIVKHLELMLSDVKGSHDISGERKSVSQGIDRDRYLPLLEKALLVQGDAKLSLMMIELKCRNGLLAIKNVEQGGGDTNMENLLRSDSLSTMEQRQKIMNNTMDAIRLLEEKLNAEIESLQNQSQLENERVKKSMEEKVTELKKMMAKQASLEEEIIQLKQNSASGLPSGPDAANASLELFVSRKALETLQTEVLIVVQRVNEQNETIARLRSEIEEHRIRERTLMTELKRNINDQFSRQVLDYPASDFDVIQNEHTISKSERLPSFYANGHEEYPESENEFSEDDDDVSYEEVEYEEEYDEYTVYDEQTVVEEAPAAKEKARRQNDAIEEEVILDDTEDFDDIVIEDARRRKSF